RSLSSGDELQPAALFFWSISSVFLANFLKRRDKFVVLIGRADAHAEIIFQHRIIADVANQDVSAQQLVKDCSRRYFRSHNHEVSLRTHRRQSFDLRKRSKQPLTFVDDLVDEWLQ